ncbi:MAG: flagellar filament capping protein FliD [Bryobacteraceae bacterium]|nr:flagellar filament capping protein FliD [Bryobacteraceae bacterium]
MGITPLAFTGISTFSEDLRTILERTVKIASLPLQALQNETADVLTRRTQLGSLSVAASAFQSSFQALARVAENKALAAASSNTAAVAVTNSGATAAAAYTLNQITSLAAAASETSLAGYDSGAAVSATGTVRLTVGAQSHDIALAPDRNNIAGLRDAINNLNAGVTASILTTGAPANGNFLVVTASNLGATTLALRDDPGGANTNLLSATNQGADAAFQLNGVPVTRKSNTVNDLIGGLTFTLKQTSATPIQLSLATTRSELSGALTDLVNKYNALTTEIDRQVGENAGLLSGDLVVRDLQDSLRQVTSYSVAAGSIKGLASLGIVFDKSGVASFDSAAFQALSDPQINEAFDFLGSSTAGLGALATRFQQATDPVTGSIKIQQDDYDRTDRRLQDQISVLNVRVADLQASVGRRLQTYDALLGQLESQQRILEASIQSVNFSLFGKQQG